MSETVYRCNACGAPVVFDPGKQDLACPFCGKAQDLVSSRPVGEQEELDLLSHLDNFESRAKDEVRLVSCKACGAETTFPPNVESGACDFCATPLVITGPTIKAMKPQYLLPFKVSKDKADEIFRTWLSKRRFAPNALKKLSRIEQPLLGVYYPFWTFDASTKSWYQGERGDNYTVQVEGRDSNGNRTVRTETRIRWTPVADHTSRIFDDLLIPGSKTIPEKLAGNLSDWDLDQLTEYNPALIAGFKSETYSVGLKDGYDEARAEMDSQIREDVRQSIGGDHQRIHSIRTSYEDLSFKYIQLPVWTLVYHFGKKYWQVIINGRSGSVQGERPYSFWKITGLVLLIIGLGTGFYFLARYLGWTG